MNNGILHDNAQFCHEQIKDAVGIILKADREWRTLKGRLEYVPLLIGQMDELRGKCGKCFVFFHEFLPFRNSFYEILFAFFGLALTKPRYAEKKNIGRGGNFDRGDRNILSRKEEAR
jgi:hypothetical protein